MFHQRHRRPPFADFIPWNDYRVAGMPRPFRHPLFHRSPWGARRRSSLVRMMVGLAVIVAVVYLVQRLAGSRNRGSWL